MEKKILLEVSKVIIIFLNKLFLFLNKKISIIQPNRQTKGVGVDQLLQRTRRKDTKTLVSSLSPDSRKSKSTPSWNTSKEGPKST